MIDRLGPRLVLTTAALHWAISLLAGCSEAAPELDETGPLVVAVSIAPHGWLARELGGDAVEVRVIVPPGASPATYAPSDAEVTDLLRARIYFRTGVPIENGQWVRALDGARGLTTVDLREGIELLDMDAHSHEHGPGHDHAHEDEADPHIWLDPIRLLTQARTMSAAIVEARPALEPELRVRLDRLEARLTGLDADLRAELAPCAGDAFLVFHPAWGYFAERYGLRQEAIEVGGQTPSDAELTDIRRRAQAANTRVVFVQPQIKSRSADAVAASLDGRVEILDPLAVPVDENLIAVARAIRAASSDVPVAAQ